MKRYLKSRWNYNILIAFTLVLFSCEDQNVEKLTGPAPGDNTIDVSDRITGFENDVTGAGAIVTAQGTGLDKVNFVLIDGQMAENVEANETSVSFLVPETPAPALGMVDVIFVFSGDERAFKQIEVVANPSINRLYPFAASAGDEVVIRGGNLDVITEVGIGNVAGTIVSQTPQILVMQVPSGAPSGEPFYLISTSGSRLESDTAFVSCEENPTEAVCGTLINTNGGFEEGALGDVATTDVPGWGLLGGSGGHHDVIITDEDAFEGLQSAKLTINSLGTAAWHIQPTSTFEVDPTATYLLSVWIKGSGITNAKFAVDEGGSPGYSEFANPEMSINSEEWIKIEYEFSPATEGGDADGAVRFAISMNYEGNVGGVLYLDNLRVVKLP